MDESHARTVIVPSNFRAGAAIQGRSRSQRSGM